MEFEKEVILESRKVPVLVDFWAPWCGPCQTLGPIIEELAGEAAGKWRLVKVNTDDHPELMQQYGIRGIPAVRLFHGGEVIAEFTGALPKFQIEKWLEDHLPNPRKEALEALIATGDRQALEEFVNNNPDLIEAKVALTRLIIFRDTEKAAQWLKDLPAGIKFFDEVERLKDLIRFLSVEFSGDAAVSVEMHKAQKAAKNEDHRQALDHLIEAVGIDRSFLEDLPRKAGIAYFNYLGDQHELTRTYRRRFDMMLY